MILLIKPPTHLGMMLLASSGSAGQRLASCAVSNCVKAGSLRRVLEHTSISLGNISEGLLWLSNCAGGIGRVELGKRFHVFERLIVHSEILSEAIHSTNIKDIRGIRSILVPVLKKVFHLWNEQATSVVELCRSWVCIGGLWKYYYRLRALAQMHLPLQLASVCATEVWS